MIDLSDPISRQQTITALRALSDEDGYISAPHEVVTDVVRGLPPVRAEHEQTTQPERGDSDKFGVKISETCEDCISRQAAIDAMANTLWHYPNECYRNLNVYEFAKGLAELGLKSVPSAQPEQRWIPCSERLPECEQEVLICTEKKSIGGDAYIDSIITPALYEDGTMIENDSKWRWEDIDYAGWDEEEDCGIIPEGWWENRHFNEDGVYNNIVDRKVVAWMPLPKPYEGGTGCQDLMCNIP